MSRKTWASEPSGGLRVATGSYVGDGAATQAITGVGFTPVTLIIYRRPTAAGAAGHTPAYKATSDGVNSRVWSFLGPHWRYEADHIISLDADGFTVGDGTVLGTNILNVLNTNYTYVAFG